ncbi:MAG TPA: spore germination protein GerW family protein [bacterium]|nr:spore germination protein GerW family protein [bacterium]
MATGDLIGVIQSIVGELRQIARSESVVGAPVTVGDRTVVPITRLSVGFGAGGGEGSRPDKGTGFAGGGGGGAMIEPVAFLVLDKDRVQLLTTRKHGVVEAVLDAAPDLISSIKSWSEKKSTEPPHANP